MTEEQWRALRNFIKSEARCHPNMDCGEELIRMEYEEEARKALVTE